MIKLRYPKPSDNKGEKWGQCAKCGVFSDVSDSSYCGRWYPQSQLVNYKGKWYCTTHFNWKQHEMIDEHDIWIDEGDRGEGL